jgi:glycine/D-amino acid oxidase-like deaminating enzyme
VKSYDYLIAGRGLAGSIIALQLVQKGRSVLLVDDPGLSSSSRVAAGLYNPVVFKRLNKSWLADDIIPFLERFYAEQQTILGRQFWTRRSIIKIFAEEQEIALWRKKAIGEMSEYLEPELKSMPEEIFNNELGIGVMRNGGSVDTVAFMDAVRNYLMTNALLLEERFHHDQLNLSDGGVEYKGMAAKQIIFCEGYRAMHNPLFTWLPFKLTKGEVLTVEIDSKYSIPFDSVINKRVFILPLGDNRYRVGATYNWVDIDEEPTIAGREEISEKLRNILKIPFMIVTHEAGIRPTVDDRRPFLGKHPDHPNVAIFNGMGSKTVMLGPWFAAQLIEHLEEGTPLHPESDIRRYYRLKKES